MAELPPIPTMGVGSYAAPGWFTAMQRTFKPEQLGEIDRRELVEDATRVTVDDQLEAGLDVLSDGEMRRQRFVFEVLGKISGIERVPPPRRLGIPGYDMAPSFVAREPLTAEDGLGAVAEFETVKRMAPDKPIKIAIPGPLTFAGFIAAGDRDPETLMDELVGIVRAELDALTAAGCDYLQLDEPGLPHPPYGLSIEDAAEPITRALQGVPGRRAVHVCYGNNAGRPMADRKLEPLMPALERIDCDQFLLEFATKQMSDIELLAPLSERFDIAAGVIDVKNFHLESPEDVAERLGLVAKHVPIGKLAATADCGFSALPRYLAKQKLIALVDGTRLARERL